MTHGILILAYVLPVLLFSGVSRCEEALTAVNESSRHIMAKFSSSLVVGHERHSATLEVFRRWAMSAEVFPSESHLNDLAAIIRSNENDAEALYYAGLAAYHRLMLHPQLGPADFLRRAAELGHDPAAAKLFHFQLLSDGESPNPESLQKTRDLADNGVGEAWLALGDYHRLAVLRGDENRSQDAEQCFNRAVELGFKIAHAELAMIYIRQGKIEEAVSNLRSATEAGVGSPRGWSLLAMLSRHGVGMAPDKAGEIEYMRRAALAGHWGEYREIAKLLDQHHGPINRNPAQAQDAIRRAANFNRDPEAVRLLAASHLDGSFGSVVEPERGVRELTALAEAGDAEAAFLLGQAYLEGLVVERDLAKAAEWFGKADVGGHPTAARKRDQVVGLTRS